MFNRKLLKHLLFTVLITSLVGCGGGSTSTPTVPPPAPPTPDPIVVEINSMQLDTPLTIGATSTLLVECINCEQEQISFQWSIDSLLVSETNHFLPLDEHLNKSVNILVQIPGANGAENVTSVSVYNVIPRQTTINSITLTNALIRGQQTTSIIECDNCLIDEAVFRWEMDGVEISNTNSFTPDFEHLDKTITLFAKVPSIDFAMSDEVEISAHVVPRETQVTAIDLQGELTLGEMSTVTIECDGCIKEEAMVQWFVDGFEVSSQSSLKQTEEYYGKAIEVVASVPSVDLVMSEPQKAKFKRRFVKKAFSSFSMDVFLMNDGELVWRADSTSTWPTASENNFIDFKSAEHGFWGSVLALDENGIYHEFGENFYSNFDVSTKFEDIQGQLGVVVDYWIDGAGHHALNQSHEVISWNVQANGQREQFQLTQVKVENVKQVVSSIVNSGYTDAATAVLYNDGELVIDALVGPSFSYQRFTRSDVKKIQGIHLDNEAHSSVEHLAIFDQQDNVEIWSIRYGPQSYSNVDRIISKNDKSSFLVIMKDGSYIHSDHPQNRVVLDNSAKPTDIVQIGMGQVWAVLTDAGVPVDISSGLAVDSDALSPLFPLRDIAYSRSLTNSNAVAIVKTTGQAYLLTQDNPIVIEQLKKLYHVGNYFFAINGNNRLDSYFQRDTNRKIAPEGFSNGLGYVENVVTFFPLSSGGLALDAFDYPTLIDNRDVVFGKTFIEKLVPKVSKLSFGSGEGR